MRRRILSAIHRRRAPWPVLRLLAFEAFAESLFDVVPQGFYTLFELGDKQVGRGQYDTALVFVAVFSLVLVALGLYGMVVFMERQLLSWQETSQEMEIPPLLNKE